MGLQECSHLPAAFFNFSICHEKSRRLSVWCRRHMKNSYKREDAG